MHKNGITSEKNRDFFFWKKYINEATVINSAKEIKMVELVDIYPMTDDTPVIKTDAQNEMWKIIKKTDPGGWTTIDILNLQLNSTRDGETKSNNNQIDGVCMAGRCCGHH